MGVLYHWHRKGAVMDLFEVVDEKTKAPIPWETLSDQEKKNATLYRLEIMNTYNLSYKKPAAPEGLALNWFEHQNDLAQTYNEHIRQVNLKRG